MGKKVLFLTCVICTLIIFGCTSRAIQRVKLLSDITLDGNYLGGKDKIRNAEDLYGKLNRFLFYYDQGLLFHYAGLYDSSLIQLQKAEQVLEDLYARSITNEAASILTNDNLRPYRGWRYERILLHQFLSFNYLAKKQYDESLVETRKVQLVIDEFRSKDKDRPRYHDDGMSHYISSIVYAAQDEPDNSHISLFKSVRAYNESPVSLPEPVKNLAFYEFERAEREEDIKLLGLEPSQEADNIVGLDHNQSEIILVGYAGNSPTLGELVWWGTYVVDGLLILHYRDPYGDTVTMTLPAPPLPEVEEEKYEEKHGDEKVKSGQTFHVKFAIPTPVRRKSQTSYFSVNIDSSDLNIKSTVMSNTDALLEKELEDNKNVILLRTVLRVVLRTIAAQKAKREMQTSSGVANLLVNLGTDLISSQLEQADTRICFLLPKTIQLVRIPVEPGSHTITAIAHNNSGSDIGRKSWQGISVKPGEKRFLFFPSLK